MARLITDTDGAIWEVAPSGRHTMYGVDEFTLEFQRADHLAIERRYSRFSPRGAKSPQMALEETSDASLVNLLKTSQPSWTSPDGGYAGEA
jgi:hypothetical protein